MQIHNSHTHIFTNRIVSDHFLPLGLVRLLSRHWWSRRVGWLLNKVNPFSDDDLFDRYAAFMEIGNSESQLEIFELIRGYYPEGTKFVALMMDMEFMGAGDVPQSFDKQVDELAGVRDKYPDHVLPVVAADPRRKDIADVVRNCVEGRGFAGIKLCPPLGYYPFDERFADMYAYAQEKGVPVLSHCSRGGVYYRGKITDDMLAHPKDGRKFKKTGNSEFCDHFADPANYRYVLEEFPRLKICLAHFGGDGEWESYLNDSWHAGDEESWISVILDLMKDERWPNVYADVSYVMHDTRFHPFLKVLLADPAALRGIWS